jgi:hypothetical protein
MLFRVFVKQFFQLSGNDIEKVVKMLLVPKLAASTTVNGCGINY